MFGCSLKDYSCHSKEMMPLSGGTIRGWKGRRWQQRCGGGALVEELEGGDGGGCSGCGMLKGKRVVW